MAGHDACLTAETGTGKTLAYLLPIFCGLDVAQAATQAMVLAPTHELALQTHRQCCDLSQNAGVAVRSLLLMGGTSMERQAESGAVIQPLAPAAVPRGRRRIDGPLGRSKLRKFVQPDWPRLPRPPR